MGRRGLFAAGIAPLGLPGLGFFTRRRAGGEAEPAKPFAVTCTDGDWRARLTAAQYGSCADAGTEAPWSSRLDAEKRHGTYGCAGCGQALFASATKFQSGTGWPSFWASLRCGRHQHGSQFPDEAYRGALQRLRRPSRPRLCRWPAAYGLRYCMNGAALTFAPADNEPA